MTNRSGNPSHQVPFLLFGMSVLLVLLEAITAQSATYYVATTGSDSNPGTVKQPFLTFQRAVNVLQPGDTLYIRAGIWTEQIDFQRNKITGTAGNYITIAGYPGESVYLKHQDRFTPGYGPIRARGSNIGFLIFENLILDGIDATPGSNWQIRDGNHDFILRNLEIKNFKDASGIYIEADNISIQKCRIHDQHSIEHARGTHHYAVYVHSGNNVIVEGNDVYNNAGGGVQLYPGPISNFTLRGNTIHDNNDWSTVKIGGIVVFSSLGQSIKDVRIYNNVVHNNGSSPTAGYSPGIRIDSPGTHNVKVWNNTVYSNKGSGISIDQAVDTVVQNNIVYANTNTAILNAGIRTILSHNLTTNPIFANAESLDFTLRLNSPAIDGGTALPEVSTDIMDIRRPIGAAYDIGAYEKMTSDSSSPNTPKQLAIR